MTLVTRHLAWAALILCDRGRPVINRNGCPIKQSTPRVQVTLYALMSIRQTIYYRTRVNTSSSEFTTVT